MSKENIFNFQVYKCWFTLAKISWCLSWLQQGQTQNICVKLTVLERPVWLTYCPLSRTAHLNHPEGLWRRWVIHRVIHWAKRDIPGFRQKHLVRQRPVFLLTLDRFIVALDITAFSFIKWLSETQSVGSTRSQHTKSLSISWEHTYHPTDKSTAWENVRCG